MENNRFQTALIFIGSLLVFLFLVNSFGLTLPITITTTSKTSELSVIGEGKVKVVPDTANVSGGISVTNGKTVEEVKKKMDEINNEIISSLKNLGIKKEDITTSNYSIDPAYTFSDQIQKITGYNGNATVTIKVKKTDLVSKVVDETAAAGANEVRISDFTIENPQKFREEARNKAIQNAKEQAQKLASSLGIRLGKITNIVESTPDQQPPYLLRSAESSLQVGGQPVSPVIEPGTQEITSVVTLYFEKR